MGSHFATTECSLIRAFLSLCIKGHRFLTQNSIHCTIQRPYKMANSNPRKKFSFLARIIMVKQLAPKLVYTCNSSLIINQHS